MKWIILVVLLFPDTYSGSDGVIITHNAGKSYPLSLMKIA